MFTHYLGTLFCVGLCLQGCASISGQKPNEVSNQVEAVFEETVSISHFLDEYNDYLADYMPRNAEAGHEWAIHFVKTDQPAVTEQEFRAALAMAAATGLEERGLKQIDGKLHPREISPVTIGIIERILETGQVPRSFRVATQVKEQRPIARTYTFIPIVRVMGNEIVIRQVYFISERPAEGTVFRRSESWLPSYSHRRAFKSER